MILKAQIKFLKLICDTIFVIIEMKPTSLDEYKIKLSQNTTLMFTHTVLFELTMSTYSAKQIWRL